MVNGGIVNTWICVNFARNVQESAARGFCHELAQMCMVSGMVGGLKCLNDLLISIDDRTL